MLSEDQRTPSSLSLAGPSSGDSLRLHILPTLPSLAHPFLVGLDSRNAFLRGYTGRTEAVPHAALHAPRLQMSAGTRQAGSYRRDLLFSPGSCQKVLLILLSSVWRSTQNRAFFFWNPRDSSWQLGSKRPFPSRQQELTDSSKGMPTVAQDPRYRPRGSPRGNLPLASGQLDRSHSETGLVGRKCAGAERKFARGALPREAASSHSCVGRGREGHSRSRLFPKSPPVLATGPSLRNHCRPALDL